jgi:hypothetical protein
MSILVHFHEMEEGLLLECVHFEAAGWVAVKMPPDTNGRTPDAQSLAHAFIRINRTKMLCQ